MNEKRREEIRRIKENLNAAKMARDDDTELLARIQNALRIARSPIGNANIAKELEKMIRTANESSLGRDKRERLAAIESRFNIIRIHNKTRKK